MNKKYKMMINGYYGTLMNSSAPERARREAAVALHMEMWNQLVENDIPGTYSAKGETPVAIALEEKLDEFPSRCALCEFAAESSCRTSHCYLVDQNGLTCYNSGHAFQQWVAAGDTTHIKRVLTLDIATAFGKL